MKDIHTAIASDPFYGNNGKAFDQDTYNNMVDMMREKLKTLHTQDKLNVYDKITFRDHSFSMRSYMADVQ